MLENNSPNPSKRAFIKNAVIGTAALAALKYTAFSSVVNAAQNNQPDFMNPTLPYPENALEPFLSQRTIHTHFNEHHLTFINQVKERIGGTELEKSSLVQIINATKNSINMEKTLNLMAILSWNHSFYWQSMTPAGSPMSPSFIKSVNESFGTVDNFKKIFIEKAMNPGSGWVWLVTEGTKLELIYQSYHQTPLLTNQTPLLTIDCWEHAYYLDYQSRKQEYVENFFEKLADWSFAESNLNSVKAKLIKK